MAMFKGVSTLQDYRECLKKGLCEEHLKDINQNEAGVLKTEFPKRAFKYIRINILYPLIFKKSPKLEKIKLLMERTPAFSKILQGDVSEVSNVIFILDSVIIFTLCQLSQICCIGALFHMKKKNCDDLKLKSLRSLLLVDQLDKTIVQFLLPILQKNFVGYDSDIIKASHIITLIFVRNFCTKFNMRSAIENIEKDIKGDEGWKNFNTLGTQFYKKKKYEEAIKSYISALLQNLYSCELYVKVADCYLKLNNFKAAQLYAYLAVSIEPSRSEAYVKFCTSLERQELYFTGCEVAHYGLKTCEKSDEFYQKLEEWTRCAENHLTKEERNALGRIQNGLSSNSIQRIDSVPKTVSVEKRPLMSVKLVDSDSAESEDEDESFKKSESVDTDDSDSTAISEPREKPVTSAQDKSKLKLAFSSKKKKPLSEGLTDVPVTEDETSVAKVNCLLREASEALLSDCGYKAVQLFRGPLRGFMESPKPLTCFEECDVVCIKYSHAMAHCKSGGYEDLLKCVDLLKDIIKNHDVVTFPAAHYSIGLCYRKLNRFKESLSYLEIVQNFLDKGIHFRVYPWPGMTTVIQETKPDVLKDLVRDLIRECENPPNPDALCRYENCEYQPSIYYTDPDFKGYTSLFCSEHCCLQYHFLCWKNMKTQKNLTDKDFLEKECFTPDCEGVIVKIRSIDKKGDLSKEFVSDFKKNSKQRCAKWEKKGEVVKEKKKRRANSKCDDVSGGDCERRNSESPLPQANTNSSNGSVEETAKIECSEKSPLKVLEGVRCGEDRSSNDENGVCIEDGLEEDQEMEVNAEENVEGFYVSECIKENAYSFLYDFLQHHGPLKVDDPLLLDELSSFPPEVNDLVAECGGIGPFLNANLKFALVDDHYVCIDSDVGLAYQMKNRGHAWQLPDIPDIALLEDIAPSSACLNPNALEYKPRDEESPAPSLRPCTLNLNAGAFVPKTLERNASRDLKDALMSLISKREELSKEADAVTVSREEETVDPPDAHSEGSPLEGGEGVERGEILLPKLYHGEEMASRRPLIDEHVKPFSVKRSPPVTSSSTMTDGECFSKESVEGLKEQWESLHRKQSGEVMRLQKQLQETERQKKEAEEGRESLQEALDRQKKELLSLNHQNTSLQKEVDNLRVCLKNSDEKLKSAVRAAEERLYHVISDVENEREDLKSRVRYAELLVLHTKKSEYLKKIEEKSVEVAKKRKELTQGLSLVSGNLNPVLQSSMKTLDAQLLSYVNNLATIKQNFIRKMDDGIGKVKEGTPLKEIEEVEVKELPEIPCWKSPLQPTTVPNPLPMPLNFGSSVGLVPPQIPSATSAFGAVHLADAPQVPAAVPPPDATCNATPLSSRLGLGGDKGDPGVLNFKGLSSIEESFKSGMASINSFASSSLPSFVPPLDDEFQKKCLLFNPTPQTPPKAVKSDAVPKVPPGIQFSTLHLASSEDSVAEGETLASNKRKCYDGLDTLPKLEPNSHGVERKIVSSHKNSYEKLLNKLKEHFPQYNQDQLMCFVKEFRAQRQGKLSGLPMDTIVQEISQLIALKKKMDDKKVSMSKSSKVLVNKKLVSEPSSRKVEEESDAKKKQRSAWHRVESVESRSFSGNVEDDCTVCCDPMTPQSAYRVSCGHAFHEPCIRAWLKTKSNCPVCRILLLLPEEYPSLS